MVFHLTRHPGRCIIYIEAQKKGPSMADNTSQHENDTKGGPALSTEITDEIVFSYNELVEYYKYSNRTEVEKMFVLKKWLLLNMGLFQGKTAKINPVTLVEQFEGTGTFRRIECYE